MHLQFSGGNTVAVVVVVVVVDDAVLSSRPSLSPFRSPALFTLHCSCRYMQKVAHTHILTLYYCTHMRLTLVYYAGAAAAASAEAEGVAAAAADMVLSASFKARNAHPFPFYFIAKLQFICFVIFTHFTSKHTHEARSLVCPLSVHIYYDTTMDDV